MTLRISFGTWYNLVLMNDDRVRSNLRGDIISMRHINLRRSITHGYALIVGPLLDGVFGDHFEVLRTKILCAL